MPLPETIRSQLEQGQIQYQLLSHQRTASLKQAAHACDVPLSEMVRAVILIDGKGLIMAVLPADHVLDFDALCSLLHRELELVPGNRLTSIFDDCESGSYPPLGNGYGLEVVVDSALDDMPLITFEPGSHTALVQMPRDAYMALLGDATRGRFARPGASLRDGGSTLHSMIERFTPARVTRDVEEFHELPPLPATAAQIMRLAANPAAGARQLADIIALDPPLAAQVLRYANSSLYGYAGSVDNLQTAIARVLGFDFVMNMALGLSIGKALRVPQDGPFGLDAFWLHAVCAARLVEMLAQQMPAGQRPARGNAYLAGLLQNLGRLVLGHTFQPEFFLLNRFAEANPDMPIRELERHVLGVSHETIGAWLMETWGLPDSLVTAVRHHHDETYMAAHAVYPQLVLIANRALAMHGIGELDTPGFPWKSLEFLGITENSILESTDRLLQGHAELNDLARRLAA